VVLTVGLLTASGVLWLLGLRHGADTLWSAGTVFALIPASYVVISALIRRHVGVNLIAPLSLVGTLLVGEYLAGALIGVMLATGHALDAAAEQRASRDLRALLDRTPRTARRRTGDVVESIPLEQVVVGDLIVVGPLGHRFLVLAAQRGLRRCCSGSAADGQ
jgi:cation transport ATPase